MKKKMLGDGSEEDEFREDQKDMKEGGTSERNDSEDNDNDSTTHENNDNENNLNDNNDSSSVGGNDHNNVDSEQGSKEDASKTNDNDDDNNDDDDDDDEDEENDNGKDIEDEDMDEEEDDSKDDSKDDDSWSPKPGQRSSTRLRNSGKRPKLTELPTTSDEEDFESDSEVRYERKEQGKKRGRKPSAPKPKAPPRPRGRPRKLPELDAKKIKELVREAKAAKKVEEPASKSPKEFASGAFVVLKSDFHGGTTPAIWKIDGKALLQKYTPFEQDGQTLYKNTSTYSGWTPNNKDQYYPATVEYKTQNRKETIVKFKRETIVADDSD